MKLILQIIGTLLYVIICCLFIVLTIVLFIPCTPFILLGAPAIMCYGSTKFDNWPMWAIITTWPYHFYHKMICKIIGTKQNLECYG